MTHKAPGKAHRKGISLIEIMRKFPDDATAEAWFIKRRWRSGISCPHCGSVNVQTGAHHKSMPFRCREKGCAKRFSTKTGTVMEGSKLGFQVWIVAAFLLSTSLKSVSSMKLHRDLNINQRSAWFLAHRLRVAFAERDSVFGGPLEVDETYMGGSRKTMPKAKRQSLTGRGIVGKTPVAGIKDRASRRIHAQVVPSTSAKSLQGFIRDNAGEASVIYTDEHRAYIGLEVDFEHETVNHSIGE